MRAVVFVGLPDDGGAPGARPTSSRAEALELLFGAEHVEAYKPAPAPYEHAAESVGLEPSRSARRRCRKRSR